MNITNNSKFSNIRQCVYIYIMCHKRPTYITNNHICNNISIDFRHYMGQART